MNASEAAMLCRYVAACCPQQKLDEYTADAWGDLLADVSYADAKTAAATVARRQPFVAPAEIRAEVRRIRADRLERHGDPIPPPGLNPADHAAWLRAARTAIADGNPPTMPELEPDPGHARKLAALITGGTHE